MKKLKMFNKSGTGPGYRIENKAEETEIFIYDEIGWYGVEAESFVKELKEVTGDITVRINSPGGSVFDGMAIHNAIKDHKGKKTVIIDGLAASAASYIALAGDIVKINQGAFFMIHNAMSCAIGNAVDFQKEANLLTKIDEQIAGFYTRKTGKTMEEIKAKMGEETWFTAEESVEFGLADEIIEKEPEENLFDLSVFNNVPGALNKTEDRETRPPKDFEKALRDAGMSRSEAKAVLAGGLKAIEDPEPMPEPEVKPTEPTYNRRLRDDDECECELILI